MDTARIAGLQRIPATLVLDTGTDISRRIAGLVWIARSSVKVIQVG